jgi:hypothetical protein
MFMHLETPIRSYKGLMGMRTLGVWRKIFSHYKPFNNGNLQFYWRQAEPRVYATSAPY